MNAGASGQVVRVTALAAAAQAAVLDAEALARAATPWPADLRRFGFSTPAFRLAGLSLALACLPRSPPGIAPEVEVLGADQRPPGWRMLVLRVNSIPPSAISVAVHLIAPADKSHKAAP